MPPPPTTEACDEAMATELAKTMECEESEESSDEDADEQATTEPVKCKAKSKPAKDQAKKAAVVPRPFKNLTMDVLNNRITKLHTRSVGFRKKIEHVRQRRRAFEREMKLRDIENS